MKPVLVVDGKKPCSRCGETKGEHEFDADPRSKSRLRSQCRDCAKIYKSDPVNKRNWWLMKEYGITQDFYDSILEEQDNSCGICGKHISEFDTKLCVDHEHGKFGPESIRGILCKPCNSGIAYLGDTLEDVQKAVAYMLRYHGSADNGSN